LPMASFTFMPSIVEVQTPSFLTTCSEIKLQVALVSNK
jgi:hypothetical protein